MVINLSNIVSVGDKQVASGINSNLDTAAIIESLVEVRQLPITDLEDDIELNNSKVTAFGELKTILDAMQNAANFLRNPPGVNQQINNTFEFRTSTLASNTTIAASTYLSASVAPGGSTGIYEVQIGNIAEAKLQRSESFSSQTADVTEAAGGSTSGLFSAGTFQITGLANTDVGDKLVSADYSTTGSVSGIVSSIGTFTVPAANAGDTALVGTPFTNSADFTGTYSGGNITMNISVNGNTYTTGSVSGSGVSSLTFTHAATGTAFTVGLSPSQTVTDQSETDTLADNIQSGLNGITVFNQRMIGNFDITGTTAPIKLGTTGTTVTPFATLERDDVFLTSSAFNATDGTHGAFGEFTVNAVSSSTADDGIISVVIDGETYQQTGLGGQLARTATGDTLVSADFSTQGSVSGAVSSIGNFVVSGSGDTGLVGSVFTDAGDFTATYNGVNDVVFNIVVGANTYTTGTVDAANITTPLTFTHAGTGTSFDVGLTTSPDSVTSQGEADTYIDNIQAGLTSIAVHQERELQNFKAVATTGGVLSGLTSTHITLQSDQYNASGTAGALGAFVVTAVSQSGADDGTVSVTIGGEAYTASGLGTAANDTHTANIVLTGSSGRQLEIDISDASVTMDFSTSAKATELETALNKAFGVGLHNDNLVLTSTTTTKTLTINLESAGTTGVGIDLTTTDQAQAVEDALDKVFGVRQTNITIAEDDSLVDIRSAINSQSNKTGVTASILQISDTEFKLQLQADKEGINNSFTTIDANGVLSDVTFTIDQAHEDALLSIDGVTINRTTNTISDVINGHTYTLLDETPDYGGGSPTTITNNVTADTATASAGIFNFVNAYNDLRVFAADQTRRDDEGELLEDAVLGVDSTLRTMLLQFDTEINKVVAGVSDTNFQQISNVGITLTDFDGDDDIGETSNILDVNTDKLNKELAANYNKLREIFEYTFTSSSSKLAVFSRTNSGTLTDFKVDIDTTRTAGDEVRILDTNSNFLFNATLTATNGGYRITGQADTKLAAQDYTVTGVAQGILTTEGMHDIAVTNGDGDVNLKGTVSGFSATVDGTNVDIEVTINGSVYKAEDVAANTGGSSDSIAAGDITFTNSNTGTSFTIELSSAYVIAGSQTNANTFASDLDTALADQVINQTLASTGSLEGLTLIYSGDGTDVIDVTISQGIGDRFYNLLDSFLDEEDGTIKTAIETLGDEEDDLEEEIAKLESDIESFRLLLLEQFTNMEEQISRVNTLLQFLETQNDFFFSSNS